jgi:hypothetical protein
VILSTEVLLVGGVAAFYLFDSAMLLYADEVIFTESCGSWSWSAGSAWQLLRRNPYLPNPLSPDSLLFRASWSLSPPTQPESHRDSLRMIADALAPLRRAVVVLLVLLLVGLPVYLYIGLDNLLFLLALAIYLAALVVAILLFQRRRLFGLSNRECAELALGSLACPPLAINLVRKITLRTQVTKDPLAFAQERLDAESFARFLRAARKWIDEELEWEAAGSARQAELGRYRARIEALQA